MDHLCYLCLVFFMLSRLFIAALWSPAGKGLTSWLLFVMFNSAFVTFPCGILSQVLCLSVPIPDLCHLSYFFRDSKFFLEIWLYINNAVISQRTSLYALCEQLRCRSVRRFLSN